MNAKTIYKYVLELGEQFVKMPIGSVPLDVQVDAKNGAITLWALVDPQAELQEVRFDVVGTGHSLPDSCSPNFYLGTVQQGPFVWHVFGRLG